MHSQMPLRRRSPISRRPCRFVLLLAAALLLHPRPGRADGVKRVILMETMPVAAVLEQSKWFQHHLAEMGHVPGKSLHLEILRPKGDRDRASRLLDQALMGPPPDLVATVATMASQVAVKRLAGTDVPILFFCVSDPVGAGIVDRIGAPSGTNVTGRVYTVSRESKIRMALRLVSQAVETRPIRFGFIHSDYPSSVGDLRELSAVAAQREDVVFVPHELPYRKVPEGLEHMLADVKAGMAALAGRVDFWWEPSGPLGETVEYSRILMEDAVRPVAFGTKLDSVRMGALLHVTPDWKASGRETAAIADALLKGADPGTIPVTPPDAFLLGLNLTTALKLKIVVPPDLIQLAGAHVYR